MDWLLLRTRTRQRALSTAADHVEVDLDSLHYWRADVELDGRPVLERNPSRSTHVDLSIHEGCDLAMGRANLLGREGLSPDIKELPKSK